MASVKKIIINKSDLITGLKNVMPKMDVIAPTKGIEGETHFRQVESVDEICWEYGHDLYPTKNFFFQHEEDMLTYKLGSEIKVEPVPGSEKEMVIFGIRSCDVTGLVYTDHFFSQFDNKDDYYQQKREKSILISMACLKPPHDTCFCICCNAGPFLESGFDLQLVDLGDEYLVDIGSEKGQKFLDEAQIKSFSEATGQHNDKVEVLKKEADTHFETAAYLAKGIMQVTSGDVNEELWDDFGEACISCGSCTHLCPMCTCFDVYDWKNGRSSGVRSRCWDSCQYSGYTMEASGHNPRADAKDRIKRRCYHKLSYSYMKQNNNFHGCVGCGRCVSGCAVFLDIPNIVKRIRREGIVEENK